MQQVPSTSEPRVLNLLLNLHDGMYHLNVGVGEVSPPTELMSSARQ